MPPDPKTPVPSTLQFPGARVVVKTWTDDIEASALGQLENLARLPIVHGHVAAMPDVHAGIGSTVGAVIPTRGAVIPAAVGVDIGCGMNAVRLSLSASQLPAGLRRVREEIEKAVPVGFDMHRRDVARPATVARVGRGLQAVLARHPKLEPSGRPFRTWVRQLGTLGGGNHFIELCIDEADATWIMLHSGSRGIGNRIGRHFIEVARRTMEDRLGSLPDHDLAWLDEGTTAFDDYLRAVTWAQDYAMENRREMMRLIVEALRKVLPPFTLEDEAVNCHHNYVVSERHLGARVYVTRKGAIRAGAGELGIIPGSMGACSYIVRGRGSVDSFDSCAHGAGRRMSRAAAKKRFSPADLAAQTRHVECRKDRGVIDEIPGAYKDIDAVMAKQADLVKVVHTLRQVICVKG